MPGTLAPPSHSIGQMTSGARQAMSQPLVDMTDDDKRRGTPGSLIVQDTRSLWITLGEKQEIPSGCGDPGIIAGNKYPL